MLTMDIFRLLLPYWRIECQTDLTYDQIGQCLLENVITGFSFYSRKPYYGSFTPQAFSVRRPWSKFKKISLAPSVRGKYAMRDGKMAVTLSVRPHPIWLTIFVLFVSQGLVYWVAVFPEVYRTWDISLLLRGFFPLAIVYAFPWLLFRAQCGADLRFWKQALQLREIAR
jgi:hypothetical protein